MNELIQNMHESDGGSLDPLLARQNCETAFVV